MIYPIAIHKETKSDYGVTVPDLPGCFSAGSTLDEAIVMAKEAIEFHLEGMIEDGDEIPDVKSIEHHQANKDFAGAMWALVEIDPAKLPQKAVRINITFPERTLGAVDRFAERHGETRSGLLVKAAADYMRKATEEPSPAKRKTRK